MPILFGALALGLFLALSGSQGRGAQRVARRKLARRILDVPAGASEEEVHAAWRRRIASYHPDRGGSADDAARINAARDVLLGE